MRYDIFEGALTGWFFFGMESSESDRTSMNSELALYKRPVFVFSDN